jgi:hypothetical protein
METPAQQTYIERKAGKFMFWIGKTRGGKIVGLIASIIFFALGASGEWVLLGTQSSEALMLLAGIFGIVNIVGLIIHKNDDIALDDGALEQHHAAEKLHYKKQSLEFEREIVETLDSSPNLSAPHTITIVPAHPPVDSEYEVYTFTMNGKPIGEMSKDSPELMFTTDKVTNVISVTSIEDAWFCFFEVNTDGFVEGHKGRMTFFPAHNMGKEFAVITDDLWYLPMEYGELPSPTAQPTIAEVDKEVFCSYCGFTLDGSVKFCPSCGETNVQRVLLPGEEEPPPSVEGLVQPWFFIGTKAYIPKRKKNA